MVGLPWYASGSNRWRIRVLDCLHLGSTKETGSIGGSVPVAAPEQIHAEKRLASVNDFKACIFPTMPCFHFLQHTSCPLRVSDALVIDWVCFGTEPCPVQCLRKADPDLHAQFSENSPCRAHDRPEIVLHAWPPFFMPVSPAAAPGLYRCSRLLCSQEPPVSIFRASSPVRPGWLADRLFRSVTPCRGGCGLLEAGGPCLTIASGLAASAHRYDPDQIPAALSCGPPGGGGSTRGLCWIVTV